MKKYSANISARKINQFCSWAFNESARTSCLIVPVVTAIISDQGASPAAIMEEVSGYRDHTPSEALIKKLESWGLIQLNEVPASQRVGDMSKKRIWITKKGADAWGLKLQ